MPHRRRWAVAFLFCAARAIAQVPAAPPPAGTHVVTALRFGYQSSSEHSSADAKVDETVLHLLAHIDSLINPDGVKRPGGSCREALDSVVAGDAENPGVSAPSSGAYVSSDGSHAKTTIQSSSALPGEAR